MDCRSRGTPCAKLPGAQASNHSLKMASKQPKPTSLPYSLAQTSMFASLTYCLAFRRSPNRFMSLLLASGMLFCTLTSLDTAMDAFKVKQSEAPKENH